MNRYSLHSAFCTKEQRIKARYIPPGSTRVELKNGAGVAYLYRSRDRWSAIVYRGAAGRPEFHTSYRTEAQRNANVRAFLDSCQSSVERKAKARADKAAWVNPLEVGQVLVSSWGYDQTNVDFYAVTRVNGRRVWIRPIKQTYTETGFMSGRCRPAMPIEYTGAESLHVAQPGGMPGAYAVSVKVGSNYAHLAEDRDYHSTSYA